ncbi:MAG: TonB-dependent receptor, partial [Puniceicoccales bacterium]|nr:TonB-dependent receptor [Puniceicoccales bacterium]
CDNELRIQEDNALRTTTDTPFLTSLGLVYRVPDVPGLSFAAQIDNLWGVDFEEVPLVPGTPRTWSIRATYEW